MSIYIDGGDFIGKMEKRVCEFDDELVPEVGPFGDYYVPRAKRDRSEQLRVALDALEELCAGCRKPPQSCSCAEAADLDRRYQRDQQDRANARVDWEHSE